MFFFFILISSLFFLGGVEGFKKRDDKGGPPIITLRDGNPTSLSNLRIWEAVLFLFTKDQVVNSNRKKNKFYSF